MLLAEEFNLIKHITDHPWPGFQWNAHLPLPAPFDKITLMSSGIASMIVVAVLLLAVVIPLARRQMNVPKGGRNLVEILVLFVRDMIARPALHDRASYFLPFLLTQFVFFLGMNLIGLLPLAVVTDQVHINGNAYPLGFTPTSILTVTGAHATLVLVLILIYSLSEQGKRFKAHHGGPGVVAYSLSPLLFIKSLVPTVPGAAGYVLWPLLAMIEITSVISKCFALMIRIFANMLAGHCLLAVFMMFIVGALEAGKVQLATIYPLSVIVSVALSLMELMVGAIQAYIFTFLTALFIGLYVEPAH